MILFLYLFWIVLNQKITLEIALIGIVVVAAVFAFMCRAMSYSFRLELCVYRLVPLGILFALRLVWEVIKSNFVVARLVLKHHKNNKPYIVHVKVPLEHRVLRTLYANSITLTPGTITMDVAEDEEGKHYYYIHWIDVTETDREKAGEIIKGTMEKWIGRIWK